MKTIIFVTTNRGKVASLRRALDRAGLSDVAIDVRSLDVIEPQADSCEVAARSKARQAYELVAEPALVDDSSFHIAALGGFPGVYAKYMNDTLGAEGIVGFMKGKSDRSAHFEGVLVYIDDIGEYIFHEKPYRGQIATEVHDITEAAPWSDLFKIFIPDGSSRVLGNMTPEDKVASYSEGANKYTQFVEWLKNRQQ